MGTGQEVPTRTFKKIRQMLDYREDAPPSIGDVMAWDGNDFGPSPVGEVGALLAENNLSDVQDLAETLVNLGMGTAAHLDYGTTSGTVPVLGSGGRLAPARLGSGGAGVGAKFLADNSMFQTIDLSGYAPLAGATFLGDISVPDEVYGSGWNSSLEVPTKNAVYDKIQTLPDDIGDLISGATSAAGGLALTTSTTLGFEVINSAHYRVQVSSATNFVELWKDNTPSKAAAFGMTNPGVGVLTDDLIFSLYNGSSWREGFRVGNSNLATTFAGALSAASLTLGSTNAVTLTPDGNGALVVSTGVDAGLIGLNYLGVNSISALSAIAWASGGRWQETAPYEVTLDDPSFSTPWLVKVIGNVEVADDAYGAGWNGSLEVPTKNALYDKIETIGGATIIGDLITGATSSGGGLALTGAIAAKTAELIDAVGTPSLIIGANNSNAGMVLYYSGGSNVLGTLANATPLQIAASALTLATTAGNIPIYVANVLRTTFTSSGVDVVGALSAASLTTTGDINLQAGRLLFDTGDSSAASGSLLTLPGTIYGDSVAVMGGPSGWIQITVSGSAKRMAYYDT